MKPPESVLPLETLFKPEHPTQACDDETALLDMEAYRLSYALELARRISFSASAGVSARATGSIWTR